MKMLQSKRNNGHDVNPKRAKHCVEVGVLHFGGLFPSPVHIVNGSFEHLSEIDLKHICNAQQRIQRGIVVVVLQAADS